MVDINTAEFLWAQRYRPQKIADAILPKALKDAIVSNIKGGNVSNFLFDGPPGTGKTTLAYAIANEIGAEVLKLNGSGSGKGIDTIRNDVVQFCSSVSLSGGRKVVLIDEADHLTNDAQAALRHVIEEFSRGTSFIFTSNLKNRISEAVRSRFIEIDFKIVKDEEPLLKAQLAKRLIEILQVEKVIDTPTKENLAVIRELIERFFPNNRKILNTLQTICQDGQLEASALTTISNERFDELIQHVKEKKWKRMREWVTENRDLDPSVIVNYIFDKGEDVFGIDKMPHIILYIDEYQKHLSLVRNPLVSTVALFTRMMQT